MISNNLETHPLKLDGSAQAVIWNDANNRSRHTSSYYKQTDGALPGRLWKSGEILEHLEKGKVVSFFSPRAKLMKSWLDSSGRQRFHLVKPQKCLKYDIQGVMNLWRTINRSLRNQINDLLGFLGSYHFLSSLF